MDWRKSAGPELIPPFPPPDDLVDEEIFRDTREYPELDRRFIVWTEALSLSFHRDRLWRRVPGFRFAAYGFFDPEAEADAFGVIAYVDPAAPFEDREIGVVRVGKAQFPVRTRRWFFRPHAFAGPNPLYGTGACWAECGHLNNQIGILTARHVFDDAANLRLAQKGDVIVTAAGSSSLLEVAPGVVDAAVFAPPVQSSPGAPLKIEKYVAQWRDVTFDGAFSGSVQAKVTQVTDTRGIFHHHLQAALILSYPGDPGDSGALVRYDPSGEGVGLYLGLLCGATGHAEGFAQNLFQAADSMRLALYE